MIWGGQEGLGGGREEGTSQVGRAAGIPGRGRARAKTRVTTGLWEQDGDQTSLSIIILSTEMVIFHLYFGT